MGRVHSCWRPHYPWLSRQRAIFSRSRARSISLALRRAQNARAHRLHSQNRQAAAELTMKPALLILFTTASLATIPAAAQDSPPNQAPLVESGQIMCRRPSNSLPHPPSSHQLVSRSAASHTAAARPPRLPHSANLRGTRSRECRPRQPRAPRLFRLGHPLLRAGNSLPAGLLWRRLKPAFHIGLGSRDGAPSSARSKRRSRL